MVGGGKASTLQDLHATLDGTKAPKEFAADWQGGPVFSGGSKNGRTHCNHYVFKRQTLWDIGSCRSRSAVSKSMARPSA